MPRTVYLVGSVPMASTEEVLRRVGGRLGSLMRWIPDGETGERLDWITWLQPIFRDDPALMPSGRMFRVHPGAEAHVRYTLRPGKTPADVRFANLFYADKAIQSHATLQRLKREGALPAHLKLQVDLVPAHSVLWLFVEDEWQSALDPVYNAAVKREIDKLAAAIPAPDLAIQLDVASAVFARLQRAEPSSYGASKADMQGRFADILVDLASHVPRDIDLLLHFCYGDAGHKHVVEPIDMGDMVDVANALTRRVSRPIQIVHMPVPRDRADDAYFEPLRRLTLAPETLLCLGLVHHTDGLDGTRRRMETARRFRGEFGIATECGFGRRRPETIPALIEIHAQAAEL